MRHAQSVQVQGSRRTTLSKKKIPIVDLNDPRASEKLGRALSVFGVAALTGHGVPMDQIGQYYDAAEQVFAHGDDVLAKYQDEERPGYNGFVLTNVERALGRKPGLEDLKRFHHAHRDCELWLKEVPSFREQTMKLFGHMEDLSFRVARLLAGYLRLPEEHFVEMIRGGNNLLRSLHYPAIEGEVGDRVRAATHTDINWWTFLPPARGKGIGADASKGLQIRRVNDRQWIDVPNLGDAIVVQVGDMLQTHTKYLKKNGKIRRQPFMSTPHRVLNFEGTRYSAPFFVHPGDKVLLTRNMTAKTALMRRIVAINLRKKKTATPAT